MAAGAALAMETGRNARVVHGSCCRAPGAREAGCSPSAAYALLFDSIGWRGLLLIGVLPPGDVYIEIRQRNRSLDRNRRKQGAENASSVRRCSAFRRGVLANTLTACWLMASAFVVGYRSAACSLLPAEDLGLPPASSATNHAAEPEFFLSAVLWGVRPTAWPAADTHHPALMTIPVARFIC